MKIKITRQNDWYINHLNHIFLAKYSENYPNYYMVFLKDSIKLVAQNDCEIIDICKECYRQTPSCWSCKL